MTESTYNVKKDHENTFPEVFFRLFNKTEIKNSSDGLVVLLHAFLLEVGYVAEDVESTAMPENWKTSAFYKMHYYHKSLPEALCWVTFVPLCGKLTINGTAEKEQAEDSAHFTVAFKRYIKNKEKLADPHSLFTNTKELSTKFKDGFCFPLLVHLQESMECKPTFGLNGLVDEVKVIILKMLPVESIVTISAVNKDFHKQANESLLWKFLFIRDYGEADSSSGSSTSDNWKEMYKNEYQRRKNRNAFTFNPTPEFSFDFPELLPPIHPPRRINPIIMDPDLQEAFPQLAARFRPSLFFPPGGFLDDDDFY